MSTILLISSIYFCRQMIYDRKMIAMHAIQNHLTCKTIEYRLGNQLTTTLTTTHFLINNYFKESWKVF